MRLARVEVADRSTGRSPARRRRTQVSGARSSAGKPSRSRKTLCVGPAGRRNSPASRIHRGGVADRRTRWGRRNAAAAADYRLTDRQAIGEASARPEIVPVGGEGASGTPLFRRRYDARGAGYRIDRGRIEGVHQVVDVTPRQLDFPAEAELRVRRSVTRQSS